jgi:hypothetical protein
MTCYQQTFRRDRNPIESFKIPSIPQANQTPSQPTVLSIPRGRRHDPSRGWTSHGFPTSAKGWGSRGTQANGALEASTRFGILDLHQM